MEKDQEVKKGTQNTVEEYFAIGEVFTYFFRKKDPNRKTNFNLRMMHGINKISMLIFLIGVIVIILKRFFTS
ncbi:DUF6728 family protein [Flammeovirgaceae bacterium SG7u.111]|nr:DUF6728 family protein [Flammeovirgaceae bacterium SG7u.132]WPO34387.1 DUF6728 family protein [Flammeovirgaceae bacterium SG7u.111]